MTKDNISYYLDLLYKSAKDASKKGEVPVSALLVINDNPAKIFISSNTVEEDNNPLKHAEINVIDKALKETNNRYLKNSTLFVSLEPCLLCLGAILKVGINNLYYVLDDEDKGALSHYHVFVDDVLKINKIKDSRFNNLIENFFKNIRKQSYSLK